MASWFRRALTYARAPSNAVAFAVRRRLGPSLSTPRLAYEGKAGLFEYLEGSERSVAEVREAELLARYELDGLRGRSSRRDYRDSIDLLALLDSVEIDVLGPVLRAVDIGAHSWSYVGALERFTTQRATAAGVEGIELVGIEVDGHGLCADGAARCEHARTQAAATGNPGVRYEVTDFRTWPGAGFDLVTLLFPFLTRFPLLDWGLPLGMFDPNSVVDHAVEVLAPGGTLLTLHQTATERDLMLGHAARQGDRVEVVDVRPHRTKLVPHWPKTADRHAIRLRRIR